MARVLLISSLVARGHVGVSAMLPALQHYAHDVTSFPTIVLSNHPGHPQFSGFEVAPVHLHAMMSAIDANGWLNQIEAIVTGYLPSPQHVEFAKHCVQHVRKTNADVQYICDPVIGDDPKGLYVPLPVAKAIQSELIRIADIVRLNRFELSWLSQCDIDGIADAAKASRFLAVPQIVATSIPAGDDALANVSTSGGWTQFCTTPRLSDSAHGTGDLFTALLVHHRLSGLSLSDAMAAASRQVAETLNLGAALGELQIAEARRSWDSVEAPTLFDFDGHVLHDT